MLVKGVPESDVLRFAAIIGVQVKITGRQGKYIRFKLFPIGNHYRKIRRNMGRERRVNEVCWHGHRRFMSLLFDQYPDATLETALITYQGQQGFDLNHDATGWKNIGSQIYPVFYREACKCEED